MKTFTVTFTVPNKIDPHEFLGAMMDEFYYANKSDWDRYEQITFEVEERGN